MFIIQINKIHFDITSSFLLIKNQIYMNNEIETFKLKKGLTYLEIKLHI